MVFIKQLKILFWIMFICLALGSCTDSVKNKFVVSHEFYNQANFNQAKKLARELHSSRSVTFYCGCSYDSATNLVDLQSCGYRPKKNTKRANRVEWEHIMPASYFGKQLSCWDNKLCCNKDKVCLSGRACCQKINPYFASIESDLHNIVPVIGELNMLRSNYEFAELPAHLPTQFGTCYFKVNKQTKQIEPRDEVKGAIARTYLYMTNRYNINLSRQQKKLFLKWSKKYPPQDWEITWRNQVEQLQKNYNPFMAKKYNQKK
jgi:deoxyribonuclease-1